MSENNKIETQRYGGRVPKVQNEPQNAYVDESPTDSKTYEESWKSDSRTTSMQYDTKGVGSSGDSDDSKDAVILDDPEKNKTTTFLLTDTNDTRIDEKTSARKEGFV